MKKPKPSVTFGVGPVTVEEMIAYPHLLKEYGLDPPDTHKGQKLDPSLCLLCLEHTATTAIASCGHASFCELCAETVETSGNGARLEEDAGCMRGPLLLWRLHDACSICATVVKERLRLCGTVCECDHSNTSSMVPPPMALEPKPLALEPPKQPHEMVEEAEGYKLFLSGKSVSGYKGVSKSDREVQARYYDGVLGKMNLGTYDTAVEAAVAYAKYMAAQGVYG